MNPLAKELNGVIEDAAPCVLEMLSGLGRELYFPKGILTQSAEAKQKARRINATIGIAREGGEAMHLPSVMKNFAGLLPDSVLPYAPSTGLPELRARWREDRDGALIEDRGHLRGPSQAELFPETFAALRRLGREFVLFIVTNQRGVAEGAPGAGDVDGASAVETLSGRGDLREAAANLFDAIRKLDALGLDRIVARPVPETGLGRAIMDRLRRASGAHGS